MNASWQSKFFHSGARSAAKQLALCLLRARFAEAPFIPLVLIKRKKDIDYEAKG